MVKTIKCEDKPLVSVLMATFNTPNEWLIESIQSILNQTYENFEFIIVDDCSSSDIDEVKSFFNDDRIIWITNETNIGLTKSLNKALKVSKGKYIARMDADDISLPERFSVQVEYMESNPEVIVSGSWRRAFGNKSENEIWNIPKTREEQQAQLFFYNCGLTHPTAMFRKEMLDFYGIEYNENYIKAQDYGIWVQCTRYAPMAMIPKVLLNYRKSEQQISTAGRKSQLECDALIKIDQLAYLGLEPTDDEKSIHIEFLRNEASYSCGDIEKWVNKLKTANEKCGFYSRKNFNHILKNRWYIFCKTQYKEKNNLSFKNAYKKVCTPGFLIKDLSLFLKHKLAIYIRKLKK